MSDATVFNDTPCYLGEGPLWHGDINTLFWFDIMNKTLHWQDDSGHDSRVFDDEVSAAGIVDDSTLIMASATGLWRYDIASGNREKLCDLEADNPVTRSNDGRADAFGGFWIGTMGYQAEDGAGTIYRYYKGELRKLFADMTITNSICFSPDGLLAYYTDTKDARIMCQQLDSKDGWPVGRPTVLIDLRDEDFGIDGSVVDADGNIWNAQWGASRVAVYTPDGKFKKAIPFPANQISCPAFGGPDLSRLFVTSAREGMDETALANDPLAGQVFSVTTDTRGQREHIVIL